MEVPSLKGELRELIARYLELYYVSESSKDGINTENRYQSVRLGDLEVAGVRSVRDAFLDQVDFADKKVLDLGSNLGELSRGARARGAALVDGFEYDPFFVELASAIDAYGQVTRVSYQARDITDPSLYRDHYDVVLAFSVFVYVEPVLEQLARITDELLLLETHRLDDNLEDYYVRVVGRHFPHFAILGESDWDVRLGGEGDRRAVVAFAKDEPTLLQALKDRGAAAAPNVMKAAIAARPGTRAASRLLDLDLTRPPRQAVQQRFFMMFRFDSLHELMEAIDRMEIDVDTLSRSREIKNLGSEGWVYWFLFTKGYVQYAKTGVVGEGNVYFDYLVRHYVDQGHDPGALWQLAEHDQAVERVARRYRDLDWLRRAGAESPEPPPDANPVRVTVNDWPRDPPLHLYEVDGEGPLPARHIDGWHRLCSARLSGLSSYPCEALPENLHDQPILGVLERFSFDGARLELAGWAIDPAHVVNYELRTGRLILATAAPVPSPEVGEMFPHIPHAAVSGFSFDLECELPADAAIRFDLVIQYEIFPVGLIRALHVPGAESNLDATIAYELLRPLVRRHALETFKSILECAPERTTLAPALRQLVPTATVGTVAPGEIAAAAPGSGDLVIAHAVLSSMSPGEQRAFLEGVGNALSEGGYVAATVLGELARPFSTGDQEIQTTEGLLAACPDVLEISDYVKGGVANLYDLVVLRRRSG